MSYPAVLLINRAWNLSGIVARDLETVSGGQVTDGLFLLNALLEFKGADLSLIPYWTRATVNLIQGQELYYIPNLYQIETFTFNIGAVRYPTMDTPRNIYFGNGRVDNIQSLPMEWHLERADGGSNLYVYYLPNSNYVANYTGKFALTDVTLNQDMALTYDGFYIEYLRYALAEYMCLEYDISFAADKKAMLAKMEKKLSYVSPPDLTLKKVNFMNSSQPLNWAHINISPGWDV
jgi:hypothetical protein